MRLIKSGVLSFAVLASASALAWREVGHFSVCEIAFQNLTPTARTAVTEILAGKTFADQCTWPDMVRKSKEWSHTYDWHFVNVEDHQEYLTPKNLNPKGDVLTAILGSKAILSDRSTTKAQKRSALLFLGHFVGDVHQVVHIGRKTDLGGNRVITTWFDEAHFDDVEHLRVEGGHCLGPYFIDEPTGECVARDQRRSPVNLHKVWDLLMVDKFIEDNGITSRDPYPYREYVEKIDFATRREIRDWQNSYLLDWAQESLCYRPWLYQGLESGLGGDYYQKHIRTLNQRILMGGYRLAHLLNRIFDRKVRVRASELESKEQFFLTTLQGLREGKPSSLRLSLAQCPNVFPAPAN